MGNLHPHLKTFTKKRKGITLRYENHRENLTKNFHITFCRLQKRLEWKKKQYKISYERQKDACSKTLNMNRIEWYSILCQFFGCHGIQGIAFAHFIIHRYGHNLKKAAIHLLGKKFAKKSGSQDAEFNKND